MILLGFMGLTGGAVALRRDTEWHARLQVGGMAILTGPAFGRLIPMPLFIPYAFEAAGVGSALFLIAGMVRDTRRSCSVHPAWWVGLATLVGTMVIARVLANSSIGDAIYQSAVAGYSGAEVAGLDYPPPPGTPLRTGK